jgi:hypothetical protein
VQFIQETGKVHVAEMEKMVDFLRNFGMPIAICSGA